MGEHKILYTLIASVIVAGIYCIIAARKKKLYNHSLGNVIAVLVCTASVITPILFIINIIRKYYFSRSNDIFEESEIVYIVIGTIALIWIALSEVINKFRTLHQPVE